MTREKGKARLVIERLRFNEFKVLWVIIAIGTIFYIGVVMEQIETGKINPEKNVYCFRFAISQVSDLKIGVTRQILSNH